LQEVVDVLALFAQQSRNRIALAGAVIIIFTRKGRHYENQRNSGSGSMYR
jgi:hypothetical protein